ncbi:MAG: thiosulfate oxidation carrier complex protein SoxZ, partial [Gemmatimonadales bacterium]
MSAVGDARIRIPDRIGRGETIIVNSIISHPMDTGFFRTVDGKPIPAWFIKDVVVTYGGEEVARF